MDYKQNEEHSLERIRVLEQQLELREREIELLKETALALGSQLDLDMLLQLVADRARELIAAETVLIPILNADNRSYTYRAGSGRNVQEIVGQTLALELGVCGWVWRNRRPWWQGVLEELNTDERNRWEQHAQTLLLVPLLGTGHYLGCLAGMNKIGRPDFTRGDLNLLLLFAGQVSVAIENAMAYAELAKSKNEAEAYQLELRQLNANLKSTNKELEYLALYDQLTGLPNRSLVQDRLQQALFVARRNRHALTVMLLDLDSFKEINDTLGHAAGDQLLKEVGFRFADSLRHSDTVGRLGGDEFAIILPSTDSHAAEQIAEHILQALEPQFSMCDTHFSVSASIGIATYPEHGQDISTLLKHADMAMYTAKRSHFGYSIYDAEQSDNNSHRLSLSADLRQALLNREFELHYQPKVDLKTDTLYGVEALARWPHPRLGFVPPKEFIPIMEHTGMIRPFTLWAIERALQQLNCWRDHGIVLTVAVNLSMQSLLDPQFTDQMLTILSRSGVSDVCLILEITESIFLTEHTKVRDVLTRLSTHGISFSIDDFGTGYSSLSWLKKLPVTELKIDSSFVQEMESNHDDAVIVRSTVELARNLGLAVIAEGVESESTLTLLREMGCMAVQGNFISRPLPADEFALFLHNTRWAVPRVTGEPLMPTLSTELPLHN